MASYTMQLKVLIEQATQYQEGLSIREKIEIGREKMFDFPYPFFDEDYRAVFETNLIRKFYIREIGFETEGLFMFQLESWLNLNMPYFNELFKSEALDYDPLTNAQMITAHEQNREELKEEERIANQKSVMDGKNDSTGKQDSSDKSNMKGKLDSTGKEKVVEDNFKRDVSSDTPDTRLQLQTLEGKGVIEYASDIEESKANNKSDSDKTNKQTSSQDATSSGTLDSASNATSKVDSKTDQKDNLTAKKGEVEHYLQRRYGKIGSDSYAKLIQEYRGALLRVEVQIHKELQELFMMVY